MRKYKALVFFSLILLSVILLTHLVNSAEIIQVTPQAPPVDNSFFGQLKAFVTSKLFLGVVAFLLIITVVAVILFFVGKWIFNYFKQQSNIFYRMKKERCTLAKAQASYSSNHFLRITKNTPIKLVRMVNGTPQISKAIAYHRGDYTSHEGNIIISMNMTTRKKLMIFPTKDILIIPDRDKVEIKQKKGDDTKSIIVDLPRAKDIVKFNPEEILLFAESISQNGYFFIPVLKSKDNKIMSLALPVFTSLKDVAVEDYLYDQTDEFSKVAKKAIDMNPTLRYTTKAGDSSQSVDTNNPQT